MTYQVKEIYFTLQGEGAQTGRPAVFLRFAGCNLWSGLEEDRSAAVCRFCDTDFVGTDGPGGGKFRTATALARTVRTEWDRAGIDAASPFVVATGGEPMLQLDGALLDALHAQGLTVAIETNGTLPATPGIDWICVSPKAGAPLAQRTGDEFKLVYPQPGAEPERYTDLDFDHFFLQPMDGPDRDRHTEAAAVYCRAHPLWRLSVQVHKLLGIP